MTTLDYLDQHVRDQFFNVAAIHWNRHKGYEAVAVFLNDLQSSTHSELKKLAAEMGYANCSVKDARRYFHEMADRLGIDRKANHDWMDQWWRLERRKTWKRHRSDRRKNPKRKGAPPPIESVPDHYT